MNGKSISLNIIQILKNLSDKMIHPWAKKNTEKFNHGLKLHFLLIFLSSIGCTHAQQPNSSGTHQVNFTPSSFSNKFTLNIAPVLTIKPGDTINTETIDAGGHDKKGIKRQQGGNPLTGPFFVEGAKAGDLLAITLTRVKLNRDYATTSEGFASRSVPDSTAKPFRKMVPLVRWKLDTSTGYATPEKTYEHLQNFSVPLAPFLGCIGVAPENNKNEILSFFQGSFGGNMDFHRVTKGATIYLPVFHEGAYLFFGDGHALQGDGEIAGNALETSMDISFTVKIISQDAASLPLPRLEDATYLMAAGIEKKLDDALKSATGSLLAWLQRDYHFSLAEATQVLSTSIEYTIAEIADPEVEVIAKIKKERLRGISH